MTVTPLLKRDYLVKLARNGRRVDGRGFEEYRDIKVETNVVSKAEGSARVRIGNTQVLAGIKMDIGEPYPDSPDSGVMSTAAELIPLASPDFEAGPPDEESIELARVVDRGIRESELIELDKLCIEPGEKVWVIFIDIHILDHDGNLFDAASLASLAALMTTRVPAERFELGEDYPLPLKDPPISCTSVKYDKVVVMDPSLDEEDIAEARLTVATDKNGDIRAMQKGLNGSFTVDEIKKVIKASIDNGKKIREQLYKSVGK
ncbi:MAG: RNA-binding protein [Thermoplasmata archaeon]|nr:MAG: exosome complex protein Rrp42 [Thermoplasmata archaeon]RLF36018.1 MAG: RNA-binding protein [Thermoplasmata archaeon]RLF53464.1 MAG: RNA-binding protein [Thermoplasmata archaeon]